MLQGWSTTVVISAKSVCPNQKLYASLEENMENSGQLFKGVVAATVVIGLSLFACISVPPDLLMGWGTLFLVAMVPAQMVVSLLWRCEYPRAIADLPQPWRGLGFFALSALLAVMVGYVSWQTVGGGISPPTPFVNMYLIFTVPVALWLIIPLQAWPLNLVCKSIGWLGGSLLVVTYTLAYLLFRVFFNFNFLNGAPFYQAVLDPSGLYMAWIPLAMSIASVAVILILVLLDFWPVVVLAKFFPALTKQPIFAIANGLLIAVAVFLLWWFFVGYGGMDLVLFQTKVCVALIFGLFIVLVMLEGLPGLKVAQPWRGLFLTGIACVLAVVMFELYRVVVLGRFALPGGEPPYALELWLASSMLAVTFPAMVAHANYLQFWPLGLRKSGSNQ